MSGFKSSGQLWIFVSNVKDSLEQSLTISYRPRNGYVSFGQVLEAVTRGFNMGTDLATVSLTSCVQLET